MKIIKLPLSLPDGRHVTYHAVVEVITPPLPNTLTVIFGSWEDLNRAITSISPDVTHTISITYPGENVEDVVATLTERIYAVSPWSSGELIDTTTPLPETVTSIITSTIPVVEL